MNPGGPWPKRNAVAIALLILALLVFEHKAAPRSLTSDFPRYYVAGAVALEKGDIYLAEGKYQFKYLPFFAQCMMPLALFSLEAAAHLWYLLLAVSYAGMLLLTLKLSNAPPGRALAVSLAAIALSGRFFADNARLGQVNLPVAFLALAGVYSVSRGWERAGGLLTAWAAALKFMPALFLLYYAWKRKWWATAYGVIGTLVFAAMLPIFTWGPETNRYLLRTYLKGRAKMVTTLPEQDAPGQSLPAIANRLLRPVRASSWNERRSREYRINVADLPLETVNWIALGCVVLLVAAAAWLMRPGPERESSLRAGLEIGLLFILMLLISPEARPAQFVTLMVPGGMLAAWSLSGKKGERDRTGLLLLVLAVLAVLGTSSDLVGEKAASYAKAYGVIASGALLLAAGCIRALWRIPLPPRGTLPVPPAKGRGEPPHGEAGIAP
ncbi:MAG: glycosyltransferase family 87 protein [Planctomycetota bacterium]